MIAHYSTFTSPWRMAYRTAWVRSLMCSLEKMMAMWFFPDFARQRAICVLRKSPFNQHVVSAYQMDRTLRNECVSPP